MAKAGKSKKKASMPVASRPNIPEYGVKDAHDGGGLLPWNWAVQRLMDTRTYFLTTVRNDGRPHVMPIWGVWIDDAFYFSSGRKSVKARNLAANPNCVLCPDDAENAVVLEGSASRLRSGPVLKRVGAAYLKKYKTDLLAMKEPVFVLRPHTVFGQIEKTFVETATRWKFL